MQHAGRDDQVEILSQGRQRLDRKQMHRKIRQPIFSLRCCRWSRDGWLTSTATTLASGLANAKTRPGWSRSPRSGYRGRACRPDRAIKPGAHGTGRTIPVVLHPSAEVFDRLRVSPSLVLADDDIGMRRFVHVRRCPCVIRLSLPRDSIRLRSRRQRFLQIAIERSACCGDATPRQKLQHVAAIRCRDLGRKPAPCQKCSDRFGNSVSPR